MLAFAAPAPGTPLFQGATANLNPWTEAQADTENPTLSQPDTATGAIVAAAN